MAGIGFVLRRLSRRDDLLGILQGFAHSSIASTGPWIFTVLCLSGIFLFGTRFVSFAELYDFRLTIIYNFAFSLVCSGPLVMLVTRCLADRIYEMDVEEAPGMMLAALSVLYAIQFPVVILAYFFYFDMEPGTRLAAVMNFFLISGIWLIGVFLTALKNYKSISLLFAVGMLVSLVGSVSTAGLGGGTGGMLLGFNIGLALILFALMAQVLAEYPYRVIRPFRFLGYLKEYWEIALGGLVYNLAIWVDKWVMWTSPNAEAHPSGMLSYPDYDSAMFLAYLSIVPSIAVFVFSVETSFFEKYLRFYRAIRQHATLEQIQKNQRDIIRDLSVSGRNFVVLQGSICFVLALLAPGLFELLDVGYVQIGMFRLGLLGAVFHSLFLFMSIVLSYFDLRRATLALQLLFLVTNGLFTYISMNAGFPYYGYGYCLACATTAVVGFLTVAYYLEELPFQAFLGRQVT